MAQNEPRPDRYLSLIMMGTGRDKTFGSTMAPTTIPCTLAGKGLLGNDMTDALDPSGRRRAQKVLQVRALRPIEL